MTEDQILDGILKQNRQILAKAMSLFESSRSEDKKLASKILSEIDKDDYASRVIGVTGTPGVGKSTFLNSFVETLVSRGKKIAILTIDPSSEKNGGSILGDKTRMADLIKYEEVFIRPCASRALLGGITYSTRDLITVCEAAGYDYVFVESVGVGQSEVQLAKIVDFLLLFIAPGGGDDLQGIKKGVLEFADLLVINKKDIDKTLALQTASLYGQSLMRNPLVISALEREGLEDVQKILNEMYSSEDISKLRKNKREIFFWNRVEAEVLSRIKNYKKEEESQEYLKDYLEKKTDFQKIIDKILKSL